jgi:Mrp family chromosome partitioning ATPase
MDSEALTGNVVEPISVDFVPVPRSSAKRVDIASPSVAGGLVQQMLLHLHAPLAELARRIQRVGAVSGGTVVLVTSSQREAGCSTVAIALAAAASAEQPALLVDGNFARPTLARLANHESGPGWPDVVQSRSSPDQALARLEHAAGVPVLTLDAGLSADDVLHHKDVPILIAQLRQQYSLIVVDGGSVWDSGAGWAPWADVALVVCDSGRAAADQWAEAWDRLEEGGTHVLGIVETMV